MIPDKAKSKSKDRRVRRPVRSEQSGGGVKTWSPRGQSSKTTQGLVSHGKATGILLSMNRSGAVMVNALSFYLLGGSGQGCSMKTLVVIEGG